MSFTMYAFNAALVAFTRETAGLTRGDLAAMLGGDVIAQDVYHWEEGFKVPTERQQYALADALGLSRTLVRQEVTSIPM